MSRLVRIGPLFNAVTINGTASADSVVIDLSHVDRVESILFQASSAGGTAKVKLEYAVSNDGSVFGSYDDYPDLIADNTVDFVTPEGLTAVSLPNLLARYIKFRVTGLATNPADTVVTANLNVREGEET